MKHLFLLPFFLLGFVSSYAQSVYKVDFKDLKTFEGTYAYLGKTTLQLAASPIDTLLYAIIGTGKYKLRPVHHHPKHVNAMLRFGV